MFFWETVLLIIIPIFVTFLCSLSSSKKVQRLPAMISGIVLAGALLTWLIYPPSNEIAKGTAFAALLVLLFSLLTMALFKELRKITGSFDR